MGRVTEPEDLRETVLDVLQHPDQHTDERRYWAEQSCWKADGKTCERLAEMIAQYLSHQVVKQID